MALLTRRSFLGTAAAALTSPLAPAWALEEDDPYRMPAQSSAKTPAEFRRTVVNYQTKQFPGTIIVDTSARVEARTLSQLFSFIHSIQIVTQLYRRRLCLVQSVHLMHSIHANQ